MRNWGHFLQLKGKVNTFVLHNLKLLFLAFVLNLGITQIMRNQSVVLLLHYKITVVAPELKTYSSYVKTLILDLLFK